MNKDIYVGFISVLSVKPVAKVKDDTALGWRLLPGSPITAVLMHETSCGTAFHVTLKIFKRLWMPFLRFLEYHLSSLSKRTVWCVGWEHNQGEAVGVLDGRDFEDTEQAHRNEEVRKQFHLFCELCVYNGTCIFCLSTNPQPLLSLGWKHARSLSTCRKSTRTLTMLSWGCLYVFFAFPCW